MNFLQTVSARGRPIGRRTKHARLACPFCDAAGGIKKMNSKIDFYNL